MTSTFRMTLVAVAAAVAGAAAVAAPSSVPPGPPGTAPVLPADLERQLELSRTENWLFTTAQVDGAPLRAYRDQARKVTCYFWKNALSCVRD